MNRIPNPAFYGCDTKPHAGWMSYPEATEYCGCSARTIRRAVASGLIDWQYEAYPARVLDAADVHRFARRKELKSRAKPPDPRMLRRYELYLKINRAFWDLIHSMSGQEFTPEETETGRRFQQWCEENKQPMFHGPKLYAAWIRLTRQHPEWFDRSIQ